MHSPLVFTAHAKTMMDERMILEELGFIALSIPRI